MRAQALADAIFVTYPLTFLAVAGVHHVLLLWFDILRLYQLYLPPLLLVSRLILQNSKCESLADVLDHLRLVFSDKTACATVACSKSPRSRTVKRTTFGFSSCRLSCSWYGPARSLLPINPDHSYPQLRACPRSSTSPFSPPRSLTCPSTSGPAGTPRRPYFFSACSPSPRRTFPLRSSPSPGCSLARGARRQATSSGVQWAT